jgi:5-formyltetrahydrofolate cyclo-ligase
MTKSGLRVKYKTLRENLSENDINQFSLAIANNILKLDIWQNTFFHVFLPIEFQKEVNTEYILHLLQGKDKEILVSKSNFETREMSHFLLTDNTKIKKNNYGIPEPIDGIEVPVDRIDVIFVPLLSFDKTGHRVGSGKGFYDKFLAQCKPNSLKIGLSFFEPEDFISDATTDDVQLNYCVLPAQIFVF